MNGELDQFDSEYPCHSPKEKRWFLLRAVPLSYSEKGLVINHINITKQKLAELMFSELLESAPDAMVIANKKGNIQIVNNQTLKLFGYTTDELVGKNVETLMPERFRGKHPDHRADYNHDPKVRPMGGKLDLFGLRKDGSEFPIDVSLSPIKSEDGMLVIAAMRDVTERKQAENSLQEAYKEIKHLKNELQAENTYLREEIKSEHNFEEIIGSSPGLSHTLYKVNKVGPTDTTVLIEGETGTGKELIARAIHSISSRKDKPLFKLNCATIPSNLIESELFGHDKGAFTGAATKREGRFKMADGGTLFLDEIGELPLELQPKLLRVLQEGEFEPLGTSRTVKVDVRVIAATNRILKEEIIKDRFRKDLFYRLAVYTITVPPLRERIEDIQLLAQFFLQRYNKQMGKKIESIPDKTLHTLENHLWPGNIRELQNVIERGMIESEDNDLHLDFDHFSNISLDESVRTLADMEREYITNVLIKTNWRIEGSDGATEKLGLKPTTLRDRMKKHGITRPK
jgi:PAS domain S-box-containing protein